MFNNFLQCQDTLVQFGTFLCSTLSVDEYDSRFPSIHAMLSEYHINADVAFFLARPTLNHAINVSIFLFFLRTKCARILLPNK